MACWPLMDPVTLLGTYKLYLEAALSVRSTDRNGADGDFLSPQNKNVQRGKLEKKKSSGKSVPQRFHPAAHTVYSFKCLFIMNVES